MTFYKHVPSTYMHPLFEEEVFEQVWLGMQLYR